MRTMRSMRRFARPTTPDRYHGTRGWTRTPNQIILCNTTPIYVYEGTDPITAHAKKIAANKSAATASEDAIVHACDLSTRSHELQLQAWYVGGGRGTQNWHKKCLNMTIIFVCFNKFTSQISFRDINRE